MDVSPPTGIRQTLACQIQLHCHEHIICNCLLLFHDVATSTATGGGTPSTATGGPVASPATTPPCELVYNYNNYYSDDFHCELLIIKLPLGLIHYQLSNASTHVRFFHQRAIVTTTVVLGNYCFQDNIQRVQVITINLHLLGIL